MRGAPHYSDATITLHHGDCLDVLRSLPDASVDAVVTDPPYGLANTDPAHVADTIIRWVNGERDYLPGGAGFMGKAWDAFVPPVAVWDECLRVLKPGGHVLAFAGSRTVDLMTLGLRLAGFDIRDSVAWLYGSGFPKSLDVSKAIDKLDAVEARLERARRFQAWLREHVTPQQVNAATGTDMGHHYTTHPTQPSVATVAHLDMLRPLLPNVPEWVEEMARQRTVESENFKARPVVGSAKLVDTSRSRLGFAGGTYGGDSSTREVDLTVAHTPEAERWQGWGTALKPAFEPVVMGRKPLTSTVAANVLTHGTGALNIDGCRVGREEGDRTEYGRGRHLPHANTTASMGAFAEVTPYEPHSSGRWPANVILDESQAAVLDEQSGEQRDGVAVNRHKDPDATKPAEVYGTYRNGEQPDRTFGGGGGASRFFYVAKADASERVRVAGVAHPTVKPLAVMRWLVRLVTPPGGTVLEPFAGSGTTVEACILEGFQCVAIEREADYLPLIVQRINRRRDPVEAVRGAGEDGGLFDLLDGGAA